MANREIGSPKKERKGEVLPSDRLGRGMKGNCIRVNEILIFNYGLCRMGVGYRGRANHKILKHRL